MGERRRRTGPASLQSVRRFLGGANLARTFACPLPPSSSYGAFFLNFFLFLSNVASDDAGGVSRPSCGGAPAEASRRERGRLRPSESLRCTKSHYYLCLYRGKGLGGGGVGGVGKGRGGEGLSEGKCNYFPIEGRRGLRAGYRRSSWSSSKVCRDARKE